LSIEVAGDKGPQGCGPSHWRWRAGSIRQGLGRTGRPIVHAADSQAAANCVGLNPAEEGTTVKARRERPQPFRRLRLLSDPRRLAVLPVLTSVPASPTQRGCRRWESIPSGMGTTSNKWSPPSGSNSLRRIPGRTPWKGSSARGRASSGCRNSSCLRTSTRSARPLCCTAATISSWNYPSPTSGKRT